MDALLKADAASTPHPPRTFHLRAASAGLATLFGLSCAFADPTPDYETPHGGFLRATLSDGSTLELNTASQVQEHFTPDRRELTLVQGEIFVRVKPRDKRPFTLLVDNLVLNAGKSVFAVRRLVTGKVLVYLVYGTVEVHENSKSISSAVLRTAKPDKVPVYSVAALTDGVSVSLARSEPRYCSLAWRDKEICTGDMTLADIVTELNRYGDHELVIEDPSLAKLRLGGVIKTTYQAGFTDALHLVCGIEAVETGDNRVLLVRGDAY